MVVRPFRNVKDKVGEIFSLSLSCVSLFSVILPFLVSVLSRLVEMERLEILSVRLFKSFERVENCISKWGKVYDFV